MLDESTLTIKKESGPFGFMRVINSMCQMLLNDVLKNTKIDDVGPFTFQVPRLLASCRGDLNSEI